MAPARPRQKPRPNGRPKTRASRSRTSSRPYLPQDLPLSIHALVVVAKLTLLDWTPPRLVGSKPFHCPSNPVLERLLRLPSRPTGELGGIHRVTAIVPGPIFHVADQRTGLAEQSQDRIGDREHIELVPGPDVERLALHVRAFEQRHQRSAVVVDVQPVPLVETGSIDRQRLVIDGVGDEERNQLLG